MTPEPTDDPMIATRDGLHSSMVYHTHWCDSLNRASEVREATEDELDRYRMRKCGDCRRAELEHLELA